MILVTVTKYPVWEMLSREAVTYIRGDDFTDMFPAMSADTDTYI